MITKLLNRKKSYERMMRVEDGNGGSQSVLQGNIRSGAQNGYQNLE
jgi:hypothetical protein